MNIGAHVRGGGKLVPSLEYGVEMGATSIQIFTQSPRMWKPSQYAPEVLAAYREAASTHPTITDTFCHATYLINLASADLDLYEKSVLCLIHNLSVARGIGSSGLVLHVGSHLGAGFDDVVRQIADAFERTFAEAEPSPEGVADCPILIENAAGSGGTVGRSLEEIRFLIDACNGDDRLGLCIDTQHLWASGFDYSSVAGTERLIKEIELSVGMERLRCFHLNDSKIELGGNRDRHANIGEGTIGARGLAPLVGHPLIRDLPLILEVPGSGDGPRAEDVAVAKQVVTAGIELYDGVANWQESLPVTAVFTPPVKSVSNTVKAQTKATAPAKAPTKATAPARATAKKVATKPTKATKKVAKKAAKKASSKVTKKASASPVKKSGKSAKKAAKSAKKLAKKALKTSSKAAKKAAKKSTKRPVKKSGKSAKKAAKSVKKVAKKSAKKVAKKSSKKSAKKVAKKSAKKKSAKKSAKKKSAKK
jgi:deoxyribonuclease-4